MHICVNWHLWVTNSGYFLKSKCFFKSGKEKSISTISFKGLENIPNDTDFKVSRPISRFLIIVCQLFMIIETLFIFIYHVDICICFRGLIWQHLCFCKSRISQSKKLIDRASKACPTHPDRVVSLQEKTMHSPWWLASIHTYFSSRWVWC